MEIISIILEMSKEIFNEKPKWWYSEGSIGTSSCEM
jgi:hypothetical protein